MRLTNIKVTNLFGVFNHDVSLKMDDRITILHGPNGIGKTAIFRLIEALFDGKYDAIKSVYFQEFRVDFDDGSYIRVVKTYLSPPSEPNVVNNDATQVVELIYSLQGAPECSMPVQRRSRTEVIRSLTDFVPGLLRVTPRYFRYRPSGELLKAEQVIERFADTFPEGIKAALIEPAGLTHLIASVSVRIIETQRLLDMPKNPDPSPGMPKEVVTKYAKDLGSRLQGELAQYGALSQTLDRSFPKRLIQSVSEAKPIVEDIDSKLAELEAKRKELMEIGLLDREPSITSIITGNIDDNTRRVLQIYVDDVENKLNIFDSIAAKLKLFRSIIGMRFLYKHVIISKDRGFQFINDVTNNTINAGALSSGEQHEVVLLYELLFETKENSLILIDEPELSLHVAWQLAFLSDIAKITKLSSVDVLIATHSPQIINDRWDLTVELKGPQV